MVNNGGASGSRALKTKLLSNKTPLAVLPMKEPDISKRAFGPNTIPLGLIKNKSAPPLTPNVPRISEKLLPVTRVKMRAIPPGLSK